MEQQEENRQAPICPSCGQPAKVDFMHFKTNEQAKMLFIIFLLGYVMLSIILLGMSAPPEMRRGCGSFDRRWQIPNTNPDPTRCKDTEFTLWMKQVNKVPAFRVFVGGGIATGIFILYWDWFQGKHKNWQSKREKPLQKFGKQYRYRCHHCGKQWN